MGTTLYLIFLVIILLSFMIIGKTVYNRKKISTMTGMMIAMTLGMSAGLIIGLILGILFSGDLFISTILGMVVGMTVGILAGIPVNIMAVLDGLLSGLMGGMMGAMLGVMIATEYREAIVKIMFFIFFTTVLILVYMIHKEVNRNETVFYRNPLVPVTLIGLLFFVFSQTGPVFTETNSTDQELSGHNEGDNSLLIKAEEYDFLPNNINIKAGETVTLSIKNTGTIEHDLEIIGFNPKSVQRNSSHNHGETANTIHLHAVPGKKQTVTFTPTEQGVYRFVCTIPGHKESGMLGTMKVS
ncbi:plastocyanin/azurin family copper-binding protein [Virgibacillus sp. 179-BFC.A HS]|uniref:Plastocyanin/azurin family copper-binding protein n=1 Tax=Tigheibacillus jepli TaxID=3035914 RepID=A0ABU5CLE4_9BACI|nr:plastocyanin/azurin family copper-binding protein [Virgibacillus sp. 179-BFC.A HS]MDY0407173.1 plastocyanin/azurin family copper-binding protein [Virgibacillus sp. 179-BFC.A HS]